MKAKPINILIVDDVESTRELLRSMIQSIMSGYSTRLQTSILQATTAEQAQKKLDKNTINLALLDIELPDDSGLNILRYIKAEHPNCEVIMVSGSNSKQHVMAAIQEGILGFVLKPFNHVRVEEAIKNYLKKELKK